MNYKCLNPCQLDNNGKSLDEIISNEPEISRSRKLKVMEILKVKLFYENMSNELFDNFLAHLS